MECVSCHKGQHWNSERNKEGLPVCYSCIRILRQRQSLYRRKGMDYTLAHLLSVKYERRTEYKAKHNKKYYYAKQVMERALAMPKWVNINQMASFYELCPVGYHVDHIVPIKGENVCGLHVPWNLQYLEAKSNIKKSNS